MIYGHKPDFLYLVLCILAAYRVAVLVVYDYGPYHFFWYVRRFFYWKAPIVRSHDLFWDRKALLLKSDAYKIGTPTERFWQSLNELFNCPFCFGGWASIVIVLFCPYWLLVILAVWGGQSLLQQVARTINGFRKGE